MITSTSPSLTRCLGIPSVVKDEIPAPHHLTNCHSMVSRAMCAEQGMNKNVVQLNVVLVQLSFRILVQLSFSFSSRSAEPRSRSAVSRSALVLVQGSLVQLSFSFSSRSHILVQPSFSFSSRSHILVQPSFSFSSRSHILVQLSSSFSHAGLGLAGLG